MSMVLTVSSGGIPVGAYSAKFLGIEPVPADATRGYGAGIRWQFEVVGGQFQGSKTSRITTPMPSPKNAAGKIVAGLTGKPLPTSGQVDLAPCVGKTYFVVVAATDGGGTRVETVSIPPI